MKKWLFVAILAIISWSCKTTVEETPYTENSVGVVQIDSTKFKKVLIYEDKVAGITYIADEKGVKEITPVNIPDTVGILLLIIFVFLFLVLIIAI